MAAILTLQGRGLDINLSDVKRDLQKSITECSQRGLSQSVKWCAELSFALKSVKPTPLEQVEDREDFLAEFDEYTLAKCYFDLREYDRAAHFTDKCQSQKVYFLHLYARYLGGEKKKYDEVADLTGPIQYKTMKNETLKALRIELSKKYTENKLDGFCLYLYGIVLKKLELLKDAENVLVEAVRLEPYHWGAWIELTSLVTDKDKLNSLAVPDLWIKEFFLARAYLELQLNEEALKKYTALSEAGFSKSTYIISQIAMAHHSVRDMNRAVELFGQLQKVDPYRLENMDIYSNLLYVKEMKAELSFLAHQVCEVDKYRVETCCVIGNYYSLRSQHEKAVLYFQRALKLNPHYLSAWTLMGHEYMEMKNTPAAIEAYRQAIELNKRDFRAWYCLGQTYEILRMPSYSLYYYRQAQQIRPNDSRMLVALGESYEKLEKMQEAKKCYWRAYSVGDIEGTALIKLAKLHEGQGEEEKAANFYTKYVEQSEAMGTGMVEEQCDAYRFLATYHLKRRNFEEASNYAHKCCEYTVTREEGKAIQTEISQLRAIEEAGSADSKDGGDGGSITRQPLNISHDGGTSGQLSPMNLTFTP
ncbi:cell division cycle protein 23 homolog isoform X1 [Acanthaster planci]|uniref:Cyclosome subunit 8 n=1 Tax=Acanthaster planci TaxID=133434 RepID=A0A8B7XJC5_ACAPL|nr:cell division cycle protein 23 homolog isoform X1 [Acanthaster planci]